MMLEVANFGRVELAKLLHELDARIGVEVGVAAGWYSEQLMEHNPQMQLFGVDPYIPYKGYTDYTLEKTFNKLEQRARARLAKYPNYTFIKSFSMDAADDVKDDTLDFVYLDGNHAEPYVTQDLTDWWPKLRQGGIIAGHDWHRRRGTEGQPLVCDVKDALEGFAKKNHLVLFVLGTQIIREGEIRDRPRSWMLIK